MPALIPEIITVDTSDFGPLSNDPLFASVVLMLNLDTVPGIVDVSVVQNTMTSTGLALTTTTPKFGTASLAQSSTNTPGPYVGTPVVQNGPLDILSGTGDFTIDGWFWIDGTVANVSFCVMDYMGDQSTFANLHNLVINANFIGGNVGVQLVTSIINSGNSTTWGNKSGSGVGGANAWHHFAVVRASGLGSLYLDGIALAGSPTSWAGYTFPVGAAHTPLVALGSTATSSGSSATGKIDEVRVTKGVARWTANFTPPTSPTGYLPARRGYASGDTDGVVYGSTSPAPPLLDGDEAYVIADLNPGTFALPQHNFQVAIQGQLFADDLTSVSFIDASGTQQNLLATAATFAESTNGEYGVWTWPQTTNLFARNSVVPVTFVYADPNQDFNCDCEVISPYDTLANVRVKMLIRLGYPNQLVNPPPGIATLIDQFLRDAQDEIYMQLQRAALRTERFYRWTMVPGQRYYGLDASEGVCGAVLNPYKVTWVGFEDLNKAWYRMDDGIPPEFYTRANINFGWPTRYEIRSCIEIFPAPQAAYTLWIKGDFGVDPLVADTDRFTLDDKMVFLLALGNMKAHYGQKDAQIVLTQAANYVRSIVAGSHGTKRYVPRSETANPLTPPRFLPLGSDQA